jgi:hypothetical protein
MQLMQVTDSTALLLCAQAARTVARLTLVAR